MKNRFSRMGKTLLGAVCLLSMSGVTYSCSDDYDLDETMPGFLGGSIYDELKARNFTTVVKLIEDLGYKEVLAKTGSKTLFVADDAAYQRFFDNNTSWLAADGTPVKNYDQLSVSQKRWLLNGAMLNSAYVVEMLAHNGKEKNMCLRQTSAATAVDSIRYWRWDELPENLNEGEEDEDGNITGDRKFWEPYRKESVGGIYMATDKTAPMLTHFLEGQMKEKHVTYDDLAFILNKDSVNNGSAYVYGSKIIQQDVTCLNGYFHVLDEALVTPLNMAEVIRTNGQTNLFSSLLERFSAPYYDYDLTVQYKALHNIDADSVYQKRYISERSIGNSAINNGPDKKSLGDFPYLPFDPGWNELTSSTTVAKEKDMGAMFVPSDAAMEEYFINGGGQVLMDRYAKDKPVTKANLQYNLYQIPLDIIKALVANLMKDSFAETVPSKYQMITNDAQDQMFGGYSLDEYKGLFDKVLLANNGVVYVMNNVMTPADYASVIAPALYSKNTQVVKSIARADDNFIQGNAYESAPLKKYYSTYLKAMQSRFSFFVPTDEGLKTYGLVDPMSLASGQQNAKKWRYWTFEYKNAPGADKALPLRTQAYMFNMETAQQVGDPKLPGGPNSSKPSDALSGGPGLIKKSLMIDMMDQHILVHDASETEGINSGRKYYTSRGGAPVIVLNSGDVSANGVGMKVNGGFQAQLKEDKFANDYDCVVEEGYNLTHEANGYGNGMTYLLDRPMQPTTRSVFGALSEDPAHFSEFFNLCSFTISPEQLELIGLRNPEWTSDDDTDWKAEQNKYRIFVDDGSYHAASNEKLVRFLNNYRYTIYVPTNEAIQDAYAKGLPTATSIGEFIEAHTDTIKGDEEVGEEDVYTMTVENQQKAQAMLTMLVNFVKYHFQDQAIYVDNVNSSEVYQTSCVDLVKNVYLKIGLAQENGQIKVYDNDNLNLETDGLHPVDPSKYLLIQEKENGLPCNILARDANYDKNVATTATSIANSSYVVLHQIPGVLNFMSDFTEQGGRYDTQWNSAAKAKAFVAKYRLLK